MLNILLSLQLATFMSVFCVFCSQARYIKKICDGKVILSMSGMTLLMISSLLGGAGTIASGGLYESIVPFSFAVLDLIMLSAAYVTRHHSGWNKNDSIYILIALLCLIGWFASNNPAIAVSCCLGYSLMGYVSIFKKMLRIPGHEDNLAWILCCLAFILPLQALIFQPGFNFQWAIHSIIIFNIIASLLILFTNFVQQHSNFTPIPIVPNGQNFLNSTM